MRRAQERDVSGKIGMGMKDEIRSVVRRTPALRWARKAARASRSLMHTGGTGPTAASQASATAADRQATRPTDTAVLQRRIDELEQELQHAKLFRSAVGLGLKQAGHPIDPEMNAEQSRRHALKTIQALNAFAQLTQNLENGLRIDHAAIGLVRTLLARSMHARARSVGHSLIQYEGTAQAGHAAIGLVAMYQDLYDLAEHHFGALEPEVAAELVPAEWLDFEFRRDSQRAMSIVKERRSELLTTDKVRFQVVKLALREREDDFAREHFDALEADCGDAPQLEDRDLKEYEWLRQWYEMTRREARGQESWLPDAVNIGILDYKHPDFTRQSANIGDYIQTIGSLTHLAQFQNLTVHGEEGLTSTVELLQSRTAEPFRKQLDRDADVNVVRVDRDDMHRNAIPDNTWLVAFGWYMHAPFRGRYDFPWPEQVNPLFVSFHINRREMLTDEAISYLRDHGPIGCRDWTTVYLLRSVGVEAFFSGCLTTTVNAVFPDADSASRHGRVAIVDKGMSDAVGALVPVGTPVDTITQASAEISRSTLSRNVTDALDLLEGYRHYDRIITSRLHCYLPATSLGCHVDFVPGRMGDVRFDGLLGMTPEAPGLEAIQQGLRTKLEAIYRLIAAGESTEAVYSRWRELTAEDVAAAEEYCARPFELPAVQFDVEEAIATILAGSHTVSSTAAVRGSESPDGTVYVALASDQNLRAEVPVVVQSILSGTSRPVHFQVLTRGLGRDYFDALAATFPDASFTFLPCDDVHYGEIAGMLRHITVSTMDRLLLPLLMPDVDRVIYHDIDAVTVGDIGELFDTDLNGNAIGGRSAPASWAESGFSNIYRASVRLEAKTAAEMRRGIHNLLPYDFTSFNAGVMVMDLERMRSDDFCHRYLGMAGGFGMNDQEILNFYTGPQRTALDIRWNAIAQQEVGIEPKLIHWAGPAKPWREEYVVHQDIWDGFVARLEERAQSAGTLAVLTGQ
ncbi:glycosyltransferase [Citricoccus sp. GCM10030269]|uniref:glycosyltransferase n=1 Tax=Citricoccus sp. GCM10030269 TaxID=3273388 RepID=UPI00361EDA9E